MRAATTFADQDDNIFAWAQKEARGHRDDMLGRNRKLEQTGS